MFVPTESSSVMLVMVSIKLAKVSPAVSTRTFYTNFGLPILFSVRISSPRDGQIDGRP